MIFAFVHTQKRSNPRNPRTSSPESVLLKDLLNLPSVTLESTIITVKKYLGLGLNSQELLNSTALGCLDIDTPNFSLLHKRSYILHCRIGRTYRQFSFDNVHPVSSYGHTHRNPYPIFVPFLQQFLQISLSFLTIYNLCKIAFFSKKEGVVLF